MNDDMHLPEEDGFYVYVIHCQKDTFYCGWTINLKKRYQKHVQGKGAKYTRMYPPIALYYWESLTTAAEARKREYQLKQLSHKQKLLLRDHCNH